MHVKKGDNVIVQSGADKGKSGVIVRAFPKTGMVLIDGVNMKKKHTRGRKQGEKGQTIEKAFPIRASKVALKTNNKQRTTNKKSSASVVGSKS